KPAEEVTAQLQARTAEQIFAVLGQLKGAALKFGQALSILESALPPELAEPYRASLTKLQDSAPPLSADAVHAQLADALGPDWRSRFTSFADEPTAAASLGQVHKAIWRDGREVAVKVQYPGVAAAVRSDLAQIQRFGRLLGSIAPGLDIKALLAEVRDRMHDELDYIRESQAQRRFAAAYEGDPHVLIPHVLAAAPTVLVTEWVDATPLSHIIAEGTAAERDDAGFKYLEFLITSAARVGLMHADPHPGNYQIAADGRLVVLDFGAVADLPDGLPSTMGALMRIAMSGDAERVLDGLRDEGFVRPGIDIDAESLLSYLSPFCEPAEPEQFHFTRDWMREQFARINDPRRPDFTIGLKINLPPSYVLIHRVWLGGIGVLCQLDATIPARTLFIESVPGFAQQDAAA
ncbi:MAG: AarF/ABC1/UbiB kinase family protein, partial [Actinobacteria bacterium]|nr:AarF/ABC1/UbiB kinase family protein [Actinomycetota bacterium]